MKQSVGNMDRNGCRRSRKNGIQVCSIRKKVRSGRIQTRTLLWQKGVEGDLQSVTISRLNYYQYFGIGKCCTFDLISSIMITSCQTLSYLKWNTIKTKKFKSSKRKVKKRCCKQNILTNKEIHGKLFYSPTIKLSSACWHHTGLRGPSQECKNFGVKLSYLAYSISTWMRKIPKEY